MASTPRNNIDLWMHDVRPPNERRNISPAQFVLHRQQAQQIPVRDISPRGSVNNLETSAPTARQQEESSQRSHRPDGVPLATFAARQRAAASPPAHHEAGQQQRQQSQSQRPQQHVASGGTTASEPSTPSASSTPSSARGISWSSTVTVVALAVAAVALVGSLMWVGKGAVVRLQDVQSGTEALTDLAAGKEALASAQYEEAAEAFRQANERLRRAEDAVGVIGKGIATVWSLLPGGESVSTSRRVLSAATALAEVGERVSIALTVIEQPDTNAATALTERLAKAGNDLAAARTALRNVRNNLAGVDAASLAPSVATTVTTLQEKIPTIATVLDEVLADRRHVLSLLGHNKPMTFLVLFQNNAELRATGGFIGTVGRLTLDQGEVQKLETHNVYDIDGQLSERVIPPRPLQKITSAWSLHDANWFFDFPTSAQIAARFYEKAGGETVDGVIAVTPDVLVRLLKLIGPVAMPEYGVTLTADNVLQRLQQQVEVGYTQSLNQPKRIVGDLVPIMLDRLEKSDQRAAVGSLLLRSLQEHDIMMYAADDADQQWIVERGWGGAVRSTAGDYLAVVHSNINGFKTDAVIDDTIEHTATVTPDGRIIDTVTVTRRHTGGTTGVPWWDTVNANYLRVYVPNGSRLLSATGHTPERRDPALAYDEHGFQSHPMVAAMNETFRIDETTGTHLFEEGSKTVFGNWTYVSPGETVTVSYTYELPFRITDVDRYTFVAQKQPGSDDAPLTATIELPDNHRIVWISDTLERRGDAWVRENVFARDIAHGFVLEE